MLHRLKTLKKYALDSLDGEMGKVSESKVHIALAREAIKQSPEYSEESRIDRDYEADLHRHYQMDGYWVEEETDSRVSIR